METAPFVSNLRFPFPLKKKNMDSDRMKKKKTSWQNAVIDLEVLNRQISFILGVVFVVFSFVPIAAGKPRSTKAAA